MSTVAMRNGWSCGKQTPRAERCCQECGADQWNPPQGANANRHTWRTNDYVRPEITTASTQVAWSTHATTNVLIIATLMAFTFWLRFGIGVISAVNLPDVTTETVFGDQVDGDYFSTGRVVLATGLSLVMTAITCAIAKEVAEAE